MTQQWEQESRALQIAEMQCRILSEFRSIYSSEVIARLQPLNINVSHDYYRHPHAIPLPATMTMRLGNFITRTMNEGPIRIYSHYPFPWRHEEGGPQDEFEQNALNHINANPDSSYYQIEKIDGNSFVRYALADIMKSQCLDCHNTHPQSPKKDWKVGDVGGVITVSRSLSPKMAANTTRHENSNLLSAAMIVLGLMGLGMVAFRLRTIADQAHEREMAQERTKHTLEDDLQVLQQSTEALTRTESQSRLIIDGAFDAVITVNAEGVICGWNTAAQAIFGWSKDEAMGKRFSLFVDLPSWANESKIHLTNVESEVPGQTNKNRMETTATNSHGKQFPVEVIIIPLGNDHALMFCAYVRDITVKRQTDATLKLNEQRTRFLINNALDAVISIDADDLIIDWNRKAEIIFGWRADEVIGKPLVRFIIPERFRDAHLTGLDYYLKTGIGSVLDKQIEMQAMHASGHEITVELSITPLKTGDKSIFSAFIRDITTRKTTEAALKRSQEQAEIANKTKSAFIAHMSHELRTPLNAIIGFSSLMARDTSLTSAHKDNLKVINRSGEHLLTLINGVLEMSKIEAGQMELKYENFDLYRLIDTIENMFAQRLAEKGLELVIKREPTVPRQVRADAIKLRQVLVNLIDNALKFTENGEIHVAISALTSMIATKYHLVFEIRDTGSGIAPNDLKTLFQPFAQMEISNKSTLGSGLGLPICREYVNLMGGDISVQSKMNEGTKIRFDIIVESVAQLTPQSPLSNYRVIGLAEGQKPAKILVAEDRAENRKLLTLMLNNVGFIVKEAIHGEEAIEIVNEWLPDLIFMDMRMPIMDGFTATKIIKKSPRSASILIIALTAGAFDDNRDYILSCGCDDVLAKPFQEEQIFTMLATHLDISYEYEKEFSSTLSGIRQESTTIISPKALTVLSAQWLADMRTASDYADTDWVMQLIDKITPDHPHIAGSLRHLAAKYDYKKISSLVTKVKND